MPAFQQLQRNSSDIAENQTPPCIRPKASTEFAYGRRHPTRNETKREQSEARRKKNGGTHVFCVCVYSLIKLHGTRMRSIHYSMFVCATGAPHRLRAWIGLLAVAKQPAYSQICEHDVTACLQIYASYTVSYGTCAECTRQIL